MKKMSVLRFLIIVVLVSTASLVAEAGPFVMLQLLMPGETAAPGTPAGKTGTPSARTAGTAFNVTVRAVDENWNLINTVTDTVKISASDPNAAVPANAALVAGTKTFSVTLKTAGSQTVTATDVTDGTKTPNTSPSTTVNVGAFTKLQILTPGEIAAPGTASGKTGTPLGQNTDTPFNVTVNAVDANWNLINAASDTVAISSSDVNATLPSNAALSGGTQTFSVKLNTAGNLTVKATDASDGTKTANTSPSIVVSAGAFAKLQLLMPGETAAPGTPTGKTGTPSARAAGTAFNVTVRAVDANWNLINTITDTVNLTTSDPNATVPANAALVAGTKTLSVTFKTPGNQTVTATDVTDGTKTANTSPATTVNAGAFTKLQILTPGETAAPGTASGKTGTPNGQNTDTPFNVTVNAVDSVWNLINTATDTVAISSSDVNATLPSNAALSGGTQTFSVKLNTAGNRTVKATDASDGTKTANTSPSIVVSAGAFAKLQLLMPGETAAPGTPTGKTGTPSAQTVGMPFNGTVNAVDANWNLVTTVTDTVNITSGDADAALPSNAALVSGTNMFSFMFQTAGAWTVTASDVTNAGITNSASPSITVNKGNQIITFSSPGDQTYGVAPISLGATASSGLLVGYSATGPATNSGNVLAISGAGSVTITASQSGNANWNAAAPVLQTISVAKKSVTGSITASDKIYDGTPAAAITGRALGGVIGSDDVSLTGGSAGFADPNVGNGKTVTATGLGLSGTGAGNYALASTTAITTANVTAAALTVSAANQNRLYGAANPLLTASYNGFVNGEGTNVLSGSPVLSTTADTNSSVAGSPYPITIIQGTLIAANYSLSFVNGTLTVNPAALTVSATNQSRLYGATNPVFTASYNGFVNGESLTNSDVSGSPVLSTSADTNSPVGTYDITLVQGTLTSTNYSFSLTNVTLTVAAAAVTVSADNQSRLYGATNPVLTVSYSGFVNGDDTNLLSGSPALNTLADTNSPVGGYAITVSQGTLSGGTNYSFLFVNGTLTVTPAALTVSANNTNGVYGGVIPPLTGTVNGLQNGDNINGVYTTTAMAGSPVGAYPITASLSDPGNELGNYSVTTNNGTLTVGPATLTGSITASDKIYDGTPAAAITGRALGGVIGSDDVSLTGGSAGFADPNVGNGKTVTATGLGLSGTGAGNYALASTTAITTANVTAAALTVSAANQNRLYGAANPLLTASYNGFVNGEGTNVLSGSPVLSTTADTNSSVAGSPYLITIAQGTLSAANYSLSFVNGTLTVNPAALTVSATNQSRLYGATNPVFTVSYNGFVNGESLTNSDVSGSPVLSTSADTNSPVGTYDITLVQGTLTSTNYSFSLTNGTLIVRPTNSPPTISVTSNVTIYAGQTLSLDVTASDPDQDTLVFILGPVAPAGATVDSASGHITWPTSQAFADTTNLISVVVTDNGQPPLSATGTVAVIVPRLNNPPILSTITNAVIQPDVVLCLTVNASDPDGDQLTFSLDPGAPDGATITNVPCSDTNNPNSTNAMFLWIPTRAQASTTNFITVRVTDNGTPPLSAAQTFTVIVQDYLEVTIGSTNVCGGQSVGVPVNLASSDGVTNLVFNLQWPTDQFTNPVLTASAPGIASASLLDQGSNLLIEIRVTPGQALQGTQWIGQLNFLAVSNQHSAFVPLRIESLSALKPDSSDYTNYITHAGTVAVVQTEPLLQATLSTNSSRRLIVFGKAGAGYQLQYSTNLEIPEGWLPLLNYNQTNTAMLMDVDASNPVVFYRLFQP